MATFLQDTFTVNFSAAAIAVVDGDIVLQESNRVAPDPTSKIKYFRVHTDLDPVDVFTISGSINQVLTQIPKKCIKTVSFNGSSSASLDYPNCTNVVIINTASLMDSDKNLLGDSDVFFNPDTQSIDAVDQSKNLYGSIRVDYISLFDLWQCNFFGACADGVQEAVNPDNDVVPTGLLPITVFGAHNNEIKTSLTLRYNKSGCDDTVPKPTFKEGLKAKIPSFVIEIDGSEDSELEGGVDMAAGALLNIFPFISGTNVTMVNGSVGLVSSIVRTRIVRENITFSGSAIANLKYIPNDNPSDIVVPDYMVDRWGKKIKPNIALPDDIITTCEWLGKDHYTDVQEVLLESNQIALTNFSGLAMECYGTIEIEYEVSYKTARVAFEFDWLPRRWKPGYVFANYQEIHGSIIIQGPSMKGLK